MSRSTRASLALVTASVVTTLSGAGLTPAHGEPGTSPAPRPPAVPLVVHTPYFSAWSMRDRVTDDWPKHWTGATMGMCSMIRIDGVTRRLVGPQLPELQAMPQKSVSITPTKTTFRFEEMGVRVELSFLSPTLAADPDLASRPLTYINLMAASTDGTDHVVSFYLDVTGEWATHSASQEVTWARARAGGMQLLSMGTTSQPVLERTGDHTRIDWGRVYLGAPDSPRAFTVIAPHLDSRGSFARTGTPFETDDLRLPRSADDNWPVMAVAYDMGRVGPEPVREVFTISYDERSNIEYFGRKLAPYWARAGADFGKITHDATMERETIERRCRDFDRDLMAAAKSVGGEQYESLVALMYRQVMGAHGISADFDGSMLMFSKENTSNGCIGTIDVIFPTSPFFLFLNPKMLEAQLRPILDYASSPRWRFPFAPHDLGTYPKANGQVYGGGERTEENQMPVEECGNMLIMLAAIAKANGNADFAGKWWPTIAKWAEYLRDNGLDPANQLCTDDFAGHLARNANLSVKAIVALGGYSQLCRARGLSDEAAKYEDIAKKYAQQWLTLAADPNSKDHTVLVFGKPGTWSLKYNLVWDRVLGLNLFPPELRASEVAYYKTKLNEYGVPMDSRETYTKPEWTIWAACLSDSKEDLQAFVGPIYKFVNTTQDRVPFSDWYGTVDARNRGMYTRCVVGGMFMPMLLDETLWAKWRQPVAPVFK